MDVDGQAPVSDWLLVAATVAAFAALTIASGNPLGSLGAVIRFWAALLVLVAALPRLLPSAARAHPSVVLVIAAILALAIETVIELHFPITASDFDTCYDKQGPHTC